MPIVRLRFEGHLDTPLLADGTLGNLPLNLKGGSVTLDISVSEREVRCASTRSPCVIVLRQEAPGFLVVDPQARRRAMVADGAILSDAAGQPKVSPLRTISVPESGGRPARGLRLVWGECEADVWLAAVEGLSADGARGVCDLLLPWRLEGRRHGEVPVRVQVRGPELENPFELRLQSIDWPGREPIAVPDDLVDCPLHELLDQGARDDVVVSPPPPPAPPAPSGSGHAGATFPRRSQHGPDFALQFRQPFLDTLKGIINAATRKFGTLSGDGGGGGHPMHVNVDWWSAVESAFDHPDALAIVHGVQRLLIVAAVLSGDDPPGLSPAEASWRSRLNGPRTGSSESFYVETRRLIDHLPEEAVAVLQRWWAFVETLAQSHADVNARIAELGSDWWDTLTEPTRIVFRHDPERTGQKEPIKSLQDKQTRSGPLKNLIHVRAWDFDLDVTLNAAPLLKRLTFHRDASRANVYEQSTVLAEAEIERLILDFQFATWPNASAKIAAMWLATGGLGPAALTTYGYGRVTVSDLPLRVEFFPQAPNDMLRFRPFLHHESSEGFDLDNRLKVLLVGYANPLALVPSLVTGAWLTWLRDEKTLSEILRQIAVGLGSTPIGAAFLWPEWVRRFADFSLSTSGEPVEIRSGWNVSHPPARARLDRADVEFGDGFAILGGRLDPAIRSALFGPNAQADPAVVSTIGPSISAAYLFAWLRETMGTLSRSVQMSPAEFANRCGVNLPPPDFKPLEFDFVDPRSAREPLLQPLDPIAPPFGTGRQADPPAAESPPEAGGPPDPCGPAPAVSGPTSSHRLDITATGPTLTLPPAGPQDHVGIATFTFDVLLQTIRRTPEAVPIITPGRWIVAGAGDLPGGPPGGDPPLPGGPDQRLGGGMPPAGGEMPRGGGPPGSEAFWVPATCDWTVRVREEVLATLIKARVVVVVKLALKFEKTGQLGSPNENARSPLLIGWPPRFGVWALGEPDSRKPDSRATLFEAQPPFHNDDRLRRCLEEWAADHVTEAWIKDAWLRADFPPGKGHLCQLDATLADLLEKAADSAPLVAFVQEALTARGARDASGRRTFLIRDDRIIWNWELDEDISKLFGGPL